MNEKRYYTYIMTSKPNGTLYVGVTNDIARRVFEHKQGTASSFTKKYKVNILVYYEIFEDINTAISREKHIKEWNRKWKLELINKVNPKWLDLYYNLNN